MNNLTERDKIRLKIIALALMSIKDESTKDELVEAIKWAKISEQQPA